LVKALIEYLREKPTALVDEMLDFLFYEYQIECSPATVWRILMKARWSRKVVTKHAAERSQLARDVYWARSRLWKPSQIVSIDESAANERSGDRRRGWSPVGHPAIASYSVKRSERWSILPAMTIDGYLAFEIYQGGFNQERFNAFLREKVLPQCTPYPGPRSILIMDNASIHHHPDVTSMCEDAGVHLVYLPPYSPDFNPIEQSFKVLKDWLKRNYLLGETFHTFEEFLCEGIAESCCERDFRGLFQRAYYDAPED
jgi:transposase